MKFELSTRAKYDLKKTRENIKVVMNIGKSNNIQDILYYDDGNTCLPERNSPNFNLFFSN